MLYSDKPIKPLKLTFNDVHIPVYTFNTLIVGSGAAGLNAADSLFNMGQKDIAILTEGMKTGTSKNSGDNRQIYCRASNVSLTPSQSSVRDMAEELCGGNSMDGDIALTEAALSVRCFHKLVDIGVDFPHDDYGIFAEYSEYSDGGEDERKIKSTSEAGMFTAKKIAERLEARALDKDIPIFNRFRVVSVIKDTDPYGNELVIGLLAIDKDMQKEYKIKMADYAQNTRRLEANKNIFDRIHKRILGEGNKNSGGRAYPQSGNTSHISAETIDAIEKYDGYTEEPVGNTYGYTLFRAVNIVYATGAPGGIYNERNSVYPSDVMSSFSPAFAIGVSGKNLTETKFGMACVVPMEYDGEYFKWKMSGAFQKVVPRYFSTDSDGNDEREFLADYFESKSDMLKAILDKAANWHFDTAKLHKNGSSRIDFAVYIEKSRGRKVYLDYFYNPEWLKLDGDDENSAFLPLISREDVAYRPYERLIKISFESYKIFNDNGIDLKRTPIEIDICAEHLNGGLARDIYSESGIKHFFPIGEAAATFGVYAPRGSSLNSTQVTSMRAAQKIFRDYNTEPVSLSDFWTVAGDEVNKYIVTARQLLKNAVKNAVSENIFEMRKKYRARFTECGMIVRPLNDILLAIADCVMDMANFINDNSIDDTAYLADVFINHDILITQYTFLHAIKNYIISGGKSRGSYIVTESKLNAESFLKDKNFDDLLNQKIKFRQRRGAAGGITNGNAADFDELSSYVKIKSFLTYDIEFFTEKTKDIP